MRIFTILPLILIVFFVGCKSASKAYEKGDYADAIELGVKTLQKHPDDGETRQIVQNAYIFAVKDRERKIRLLSEQNKEENYEKIYQEYRKLQDLNETIHAYSVAADQIKTNDYSSYVQTYRDKAIGVYLAQADTYLADSSQTGYRKAYLVLKQALRFDPRNRELERKRDEVYNRALTIAYMPPIQRSGGYFPSYSGNYNNWTYLIQNFQDEIYRDLRYNTGSEFVKIYNEWDLRSSKASPDQVIELDFGRLIMGRPYDRTNTRRVSKKVVVKETVYKPDSVVKEYATVYATIYTTQRTVQSELELILNIRDAGGRYLWTDRFNGAHQWRVEFASFNGDERALSDSDRELINRYNNGRYPDPREDEILQELFRHVQNDVEYRIRNFYSRTERD